MAPQKPTTTKNDTSTPYSWCLGKKSNEISIAELHSAYRVNYPPCVNGRSRTCRKNPHCLWGFGEKKWIKNAEESHSDEEDEQLNRNEGQLAGIVNLGATCYVNSLLQLWFHNPILRPAILKWRPTNIGQQNPEDEGQEGESYKPTCPISHLQAMFARMLLSKRSTIDPTQFTTSLSLNTGEQQDAQEFSNLLMTLLDNLLEKQQSKEIQNLIKDSFTGTYAYETICETCKHTSVRSCDFRELELMVKKNLKDAIVELLKVEMLANTNQYNCGQCGQRRDAQRRIKIVKLPPVLNLQLMRFIYDRESQQKKKNKLQITFPEILDMTDSVVNGEGDSTNDPESNIYILNAVLSHKGRTAHHGHYIAHIKDMNTGNWFECNDDTVQPMKSSSKTLIIKNDEANNNATTGDENKTKAKEYTSDGAYMLVYTRKSYMMNTSNVVDIHDYLKKFVLEEDKVFEEEYLKNKVAKDNEVKRKEQRQDEINLLYRDLLPKPAIETVKNENQPPEESKSNTNAITVPISNGQHKTNSTNPPQMNRSTTDNEFKGDFIANTLLPSFFDIKIDPKIENNTLTCIHGKLKPPGPGDTSVPYRIIPIHFSDVIFSRYEYDLRLQGDSALCAECVKVNCKMVNDLDILEKDYKQFNDMSKEANADNTQCVWISNEFMRSWRKQAKTEIESGGNREITLVDEAGDESLPNSDLQCDHGSLSPSVSKTLITLTAWTIMYKYFPTSVLWAHTKPECKTCTDISVSNIFVQQQNRTVASNQRSQLADLYANRNRPTPNESTGTYYLVPTEFIHEWRRFIREPAKTSYPMFQIEVLLCEHELLMYPIHILADLIENGVLNESLITLLTEFEWNYLKEHLGGVQTEFRISIDSGFISYTNGEPCTECSVTWWTEQIQKAYVYENGNIFIDKRDDMFELSQDGQFNSQDCDEENIQSNGKREKSEPIRRSKRTRMAKTLKKYTNISSRMPVKDFQKTYLFNDYAAILSDQHLFFNGKELSDQQKAKSFQELEIKSNSTLVLVVDPPTTSQSDSKDDMEVDTNEPVRQETGFRGTILQG